LLGFVHGLLKRLISEENHGQIIEGN
jgi:hypothetical protein